MTDTQNCCDRREGQLNTEYVAPPFIVPAITPNVQKGRAMIARPQAPDKIPQNNNIRIMPAQSAPTARPNSKSTHMGKYLPTSA